MPDKPTHVPHGFGGDYARDAHREGLGDDYARDGGWSGAGRAGDVARDVHTPEEAATEIVNEPLPDEEKPDE